eukprot:Nitzschia sp. Nitz4//scaffold35_size145790//38767//40411//NITZ4_003017-RA/size145790-processed-gene-0.229-mRNA-1//-1//CDS//3329549085//5027//frame0
MSGVDDELVSQFLMFTGTDDTAKALSYLEMSAGDLERAVSLFMDHTAGGGGGSSGGGPMPMASDDVRAPDATRTMRLMDDIGPGHAHMPMMQQPVMLPQAFGAGSTYDSVRQAINAAAAAHHADEDYDYSMNQEDEEVDDDDDEDYEYQEVTNEANVPRLADMFAPPEHLIYKEGGFDGARQMAKDSKRWLLVNIQKDSEFSCHALNRDVWRDELVENLIREGFIFWQAMDQEPQGQVYTQRYHVHDYPHVAIIDPRTRRLMWKKEGWTQQDPLTATSLAETIMDFCSRNSFDKPIRAAPRPPPGSAAAAAATQRPTQRPMSEMTEEEQLQAAMRASLEDVTDAMDAAAAPPADDTMQDDGEVEYVGSSVDTAAHAADEKPAAVEAKKEPSLLEQLLEMSVGDEPASGARIQLRMPDGKRVVRKFDASSTVKTIYAFIAQSNEDAKGGKEFVLMAGYPPKDLITDMDSSIDSCQLNGQAITVRWK